MSDDGTTGQAGATAVAVADGEPELGRPRSSAFAVLEDVTVADALLAHLRAEEVDAVFGIPGGNVAPILQALRRDPQLQFVIASHEGGAAFMADGYARATGKLGVCLVTAGPGVTNALTGVASAHLDQVPLLLVSGQVATGRFGLAAIQESTEMGGVATVEMARHATAASISVTDAATFGRLLGRALRTAQAAPGAAVHLSVASNVQRERLPRVPVPARRGAFTGRPSPAPPEDVEELWGLLRAARRPLVFLGSGARRALEDDHEGFRALVHALDLPVVTSMRGKGLFDETDPLALGVLGLAGSDRAERYLREGVDLLVVLGSRLGEWATRGFAAAFHRVDTVVQVDLRPAVIGQFLPVTLPVVADVAGVLAGLADRAAAVLAPAADGRGQLPAPVAPVVPAPRAADALLTPRALFTELGALLRPDLDLYVDMGNCTAWATSVLRVSPPTRMFYPCGLSSMGWSCGAVVGGRYGRPDRAALAVTGDGSFLMNGNEVRTAARYNIGAVYLVLDDGYLGMVNHGELTVTPDITLDDPFYALGHPDLTGFAASLGAHTHRVDHPGQLTEHLTQALARADRDKQPQVIVARIDHTEPPPYGDRFTAVHGLRPGG